MSVVSSKAPSPMVAIFLTALLDMLGVGIIIPVIPAIFFQTDVGFFNADTSDATKSMLFGVLVACYPFMQFFGAPVLGALADRHGRKPILLLSLLGTLVGYLLFGYALLTQNLILLFISRMLPGFFGGNISVLMSAISDISDASNRTKRFGFIGMAFGLGFILGPSLGGLLADNSLLPWFNHATPFWFTAGLTLLNIFLVYFTFTETLVQRVTRRVSVFDGLRSVGNAFTAPNLRIIFGVVLLVGLGFTFFTQFFAPYLFQRFTFSEKDTGLLFGWVGIWLALTQGLLVPRLSKMGILPHKILPFSLIALAICIGGLPFLSNGAQFYMLNPLIAISQGLTSPNLTTLVSLKAGPEKQGQILGINQSMQSLAQVIPPLIAGWLNQYSPAYPLFAGAIFIILGWILYSAVLRKNDLPSTKKV